MTNNTMTITFLSAIMNAAKQGMVVAKNVKQGNPYYNPNLACNGGGYDQPRGDLYVGDLKIGEFSDDSCGDFGTRWTVELGGLRGHYDTIGGDGFISEGLQWEHTHAIWESIAGQYEGVDPE